MAFVSGFKSHFRLETRNPHSYGFSVNCAVFSCSDLILFRPVLGGFDHVLTRIVTKIVTIFQSKKTDHPKAAGPQERMEYGYEEKG